MITYDPKTPLNVNIPVTLKRDVAVAADAAGESLTAWICRALAAALKSGEAAKQ
jgi:predicted HicB family RNase H-like nuclease